jgi:hypothetical protein
MSNAEEEEEEEEEEEKATVKKLPLQRQLLSHGFYMKRRRKFLASIVQCLREKNIK